MTTSYIGSSLITQKLTELETALSVANTAISDSNLSIAAANNKVSALETWSSDRVRYAYPNGGSEGDERDLPLSSVFYVDSPFPDGTKFHCFTEYWSPSKSEWIEHQTASQIDTRSFGCLAYSRAAQNQVVVATASTYLSTGWIAGGGWEGTNAIGTVWRVRCVREN